MFRFARPEMLNLLWLLPVIAAAFWWGRRQARARLAALVGERLSARLTAGNSGLKSGLAVGLVLAAWACLALGLARPQTALAVRQAAFPGLDVILVVDVSRSMDATDTPPSRLGRAQQALFYLAETLRGNRFGLLPFAGTAFLTCPLTRDQSAVQLLIDHLETSWSPIPGTNLTQALALAREAFERTGAKHRVLVVVSDGENFGGKPLPVVKQANKEGIRTYCLGVGTEAGAAVPGEKKAVTKLDEEGLKRIALIGGGTYQRLSAGGREEEALAAELKRLEKIEIFTAEQNAWQDHYPLAALAAAFLLWLELLLGRRREGPNWRQLALKIWRWIVPAAIVLFAAAPAWASRGAKSTRG
jgi:Ca-activated chloride channel family protein